LEYSIPFRFCHDNPKYGLKWLWDSETNGVIEVKDDESQQKRRSRHTKKNHLSMEHVTPGEDAEQIDQNQNQNENADESEQIDQNQNQNENADESEQTGQNQNENFESKENENDNQNENKKNNNSTAIQRIMKPKQAEYRPRSTIIQTSFGLIPRDGPPEIMLVGFTAPNIEIMNKPFVDVERGILIVDFDVSTSLATPSLEVMPKKKRSYFCHFFVHFLRFFCFFVFFVFFFLHFFGALQKWKKKQNKTAK